MHGHPKCKLYFWASIASRNCHPTKFWWVCVQAEQKWRMHVLGSVLQEQFFTFLLSAFWNVGIAASACLEHEDSREWNSSTEEQWGKRSLRPYEIIMMVSDCPHIYLSHCYSEFSDTWWCWSHPTRYDAHYRWWWETQGEDAIERQWEVVMQVEWGILQSFTTVMGWWAYLCQPYVFREVKMQKYLVLKNC